MCVAPLRDGQMRLSLGHYVLCVTALSVLAVRPLIAEEPRFEVIHTFAGGADGSCPSGGFLQGRDGALYGTTYIGGSSAVEELGEGVVFRLSYNGSTWVE